MLTSDEIRRLTALERLDLIAQLWGSLEDNDVRVTAAQERELDHRLATLKEDRRNAVSWADLKAELSKRCP